MVRHHPGLMSLPVCLKDLFPAHCFSLYMSLMYQMAYPPILNYLQIISLFFQLYTTKTLQQKNLIMANGKLVTGPINGK